MIGNKFIEQSISIIIRVLNILIIMPLVLAIGLVILALCLVNGALFLCLILGTLKMFIPKLPVTFSVDNIIFRIITLCIIAVSSYYLYKILRIYIPKYLSFLGVYMKKTFCF